MIQDERPTPEIVIQDESDQVLFGNLACAPPSQCTGNEVDPLESKVQSKVDLLERKVDVLVKQKAEMENQFDKLRAEHDNQFDKLRAQNEMLIEMLKKLEQPQEKSSEDASRAVTENTAPLIERL